LRTAIAIEKDLELQKMTKSLLLVAMLASLIQLAASSPIYVKVIFV